MSDINERLDKVRKLLADEDFLTGKGLSNEVNIRIFQYEPEDEMAVQYFLRHLQDKPLPCRVIELNIYQMMIRICEERRLMRNLPMMEERRGKDFLRAQLEKACSPAEMVKRLLEEPHGAGDVLLVTGVGEAYPFLRLSQLLETLQPNFSDIPILAFYPGRYDGQSMQLFGRIKNGHYYRAFDVI